MILPRHCSICSRRMLFNMLPKNCIQILKGLNKSNYIILLTSNPFSSNICLSMSSICESSSMIRIRAIFLFLISTCMLIDMSQGRDSFYNNLTSNEQPATSNQQPVSRIQHFSDGSCDLVSNNRFHKKFSNAQSFGLVCVY